MTSTRSADRTVWDRTRDRAFGFLAGRAYPGLGFAGAVSDIRGRSRVGEISRSHIRDFSLSIPRPTRGIDLRRYAPYFADYPRGLLHFAAMDPECDRRHAFFYMAQRTFADRIASIPIAALDRIREVGFEREAEPLLIFSIGRCGSTLLSNLITESGLASFSESDIFSQVDELNGTTGRRIGHDAARTRAYRDRILGVTLQSLQARSGDARVCIKMRSGAARAFAEILETCPKADPVFLFRGVESWARSWITALAMPQRKMIATLSGCVAAVQHAQETGLAHRVVWYEEIIADPGAACARILGPEPTGGRDLARVMGIDSQAGTGLSATRLDQRRTEDANRIERETDAFLAAWREVAPQETLRRLGLDGLIA